MGPCRWASVTGVEPPNGRGQRHLIGEVRALEGAEYVSDAGAELLVHAGQQAVEGDHELLAGRGELLPGRPGQPRGELGNLVGHADDTHVAAAGCAQVRHDLGEVGDDRREGGLDTGFECAEAGQDHAGVEVVGSDVDGDQRDLAGMVAQEADCGGKLGALRCRSPR